MARMNFARLQLLSCAAGAVLLAAAGSTSVQAQEASPTEIDEIVVTAQKREETVRDAPVAVSAFTDDARDDLGILTVQDLTNATPGLSYNTAQDKVFIRGVGRQTNGVGTEPGVALYNDGFYSPSTATAANSPLFTERLEILRGPQGTLYGRNSVGGAINVISARPTSTFYAEVRGLLGDFDRRELRGSVSGPITDNLRLRLNGEWVRQDEGWFSNVSGGPDEGGVADSTYFEVLADGEFGPLDLFLKYASGERDDRARYFTSAAPYNTTTFFTGPLGPNPTYGSTVQNPAARDLRLFNSDTPTRTRLYDHHMVVLNADLHLDGFDVRYVGGWQTYVFDQIQDYDNAAVSSYSYLPLGAPSPLTIAADYRRRYIEDRTYYSHEVNLISTGDGPLQWIAGAYFLHENFKQPMAIYAPGQAELATPYTLTGGAAPANPERNYYTSYGEQAADSYAVFGQIDYQITDTVQLTGGLRWNRDEKEGREATRSIYFNPSLGYGVGWTCSSLTNCFGIAYDYQNVSRELAGTWEAWSGAAGLQWKPDDKTLAYLRYSRGYKSGGFNLGGVAPAPEVDSETIDALELGVKRSFGRKLWVNAAAFDYRYNGLQLPLLVIPGGTQPARTDLVNMDEIGVRGFELETNWRVTDRLNIWLSYGWLDAEIKKACCFVDPLDPAATLPTARPVGPPNAAGARAQDLAGNALPVAAEHKLWLAPTYRFDLFGGDLSVSAIYTWRSSVASGLFDNGLAEAPSFDQLDLRATFTDRSQRFTVAAFGRNVFDDLGYDGVGAVQTASGISPSYSLTAPRTFGIELRAKF